jgi:hypothetical protein
MTYNDPEVIDFRPNIDDVSQPSIRELVYKCYAGYFSEEIAVAYAREHLRQIKGKIVT